MNCTLKAVECVRDSAERYLKCLVVGVAANFTGFHRVLHGKRPPALRIVKEGKAGIQVLRGYGIRLRSLLRVYRPQPLETSRVIGCSGVHCEVYPCITF